jgi:uncharacterized YccA/Bax inhibitor family protein
MQPDKRSVLGPEALSWCYRVIWLVCVGVYLTVFVSGVMAGGDELVTMVRAMGFTVAAALLGKLALSVLGRSKEPLSATEEGTVGSLVDLVSSPNVSEPEDEA